MFLIPLQFVLLFAVATSQIFGGISCCCLGRTLFADLFTVSNASATGFASQNESSSVIQTRQTGKCPHCSVRKSSPAASEPKSEQLSANKIHNHRAKFCGNDQCGCAKLVVNASTPSNPPSLSYDSHAWLSPVLDVNPQRQAFALVSPKFDVPVRFGGRSWQSIACLWNN